MKNDTMENAQLTAVADAWTPENTADAAGTLEIAAREARAWYHRVGPTQQWTETERRGQIVATLDAENEGRHLRKSADRRQCVGVFGPSQAGKSWLMQSLGTAAAGADGDKRSLTVRFAGQRTMDFLKDINPAGGKESTGLVTRFTCDQARASADETHPVELRLLSETDLIKVLANTFFSDFNHEQRGDGLPKRERIAELLHSAKRQASDVQAAAHLDEVVMYDLARYFEENFPGSVGPLNESNYWQALTTLGHRLSRTDRIALYAVLWGEVEEITKLFTRLVGVLDKLGHASNVRTTLDALTKVARDAPTGGCIIDVALLAKLYDKQADADRLSVLPVLDGCDGEPALVPRAELVALTAELKLVMAAPPSDLFTHTDLLDFPGARSRLDNLRLPEDLDERHKMLCEMLIRGKVAYLFQRYTEDCDLSCMLLCIKDSNQDVTPLPPMVSKWVTRMQGAGPDDRVKSDCALFMVLTWFDTIWVNKGAADTDQNLLERIDTRLHASVGEYFGKQPWITNWKSDKPFNNTFFFRDPRFDGRGAGDSDIERRMRLIKDGLKTSKLCEDHVSDPEDAWNAVTGPDGGAGRLIAALHGVLNPTLKLGQLRARLGVAAKKLDDELFKRHRGQGEEARAECQATLRQLVNARLPRADRRVESFYRLLSRLSLSVGEARRIYQDVVSRHGLESAMAPAALAPTPSSLDLDLFGDGPVTPTAEAAVPPDVPRRDDADEFASEVVSKWLHNVDGVIGDQNTLLTLQVDAAALGVLRDVWFHGAHRIELAKAIVKRVRPLMRVVGRRSDVVAQRCAVIASSIVDDFLAFNGTAGLPTEKQPHRAGRPVFAFPPLPKDGLPQLEETPTHGLASTWWGDWAVSLVTLGVRNVGFSGATGGVDADDNHALGELRARVKPLFKAARTPAHPGSMTP